jgi:hypothetical protein
MSVVLLADAHGILVARKPAANLAVKHLFQSFQSFNRCAPFKSLKLAESAKKVGAALVIHRKSLKEVSAHHRSYRIRTAFITAAGGSTFKTFKPFNRCAPFKSFKVSDSVPGLYCAAKGDRASVILIVVMPTELDICPRLRYEASKFVAIPRSFPRVGVCRIVRMDRR